MTERICVAQIGAPHGVRGEVKLRSFTGSPKAVTSYGPLESEDGTRRFEIEALRPAKDHFVARFAGVADRNAAEKLTNIQLYRAARPAAAGRGRRHVLPVRPDRARGGDAGRRRARHRDGGPQLRRRRHRRDRAGRTAATSLMVPFTVEAVPTVDIAGRRIVVVPPAVVE